MKNYLVVLHQKQTFVSVGSDNSPVTVWKFFSFNETI
jgi:hypothetical protein